MKLQRSYGSQGCGDSQAGEGGSLTFNRSLHLNLNTCLWWLAVATNSSKQIVLNISVGVFCNL